MAEERRKKLKPREQLSFFKDAWIVMAAVITVLASLVTFLITYGIVYPAIKSSQIEYHQGFTNQDGIILKTELGFIRRDIEKLITTQDTIRLLYSSTAYHSRSSAKPSSL